MRFIRIPHIATMAIPAIVVITHSFTLVLGLLVFIVIVFTALSSS